MRRNLFTRILPRNSFFMRFFDAIGDQKSTIEDPIFLKNNAIYFCYEEEDELESFNQPQLNRYKQQENREYFIIIFVLTSEKKHHNLCVYPPDRTVPIRVNFSLFLFFVNFLKNEGKKERTCILLLFADGVQSFFLPRKCRLDWKLLTRNTQTHTQTQKHIITILIDFWLLLSIRPFLFHYFSSLLCIISYTWTPHAQTFFPKLIAFLFLPFCFKFPPESYLTRIIYKTSRLTQSICMVPLFSKCPLTFPDIIIQYISPCKKSRLHQK